jgi:hypothetical protein
MATFKEAAERTLICDQSPSGMAREMGKRFSPG